MDTSPPEDTTAREQVPLAIRVASEWAVRGLLIGAACYAILWAMGHLKPVVVPIIVAVLLAALLQPIYQRLAAVMHKGPAAGVTVVGTLAIIISLVALVISQMSDQLPEMTSQLANGLDEMRAWLRDTLHISDTQVSDYLTKARQQIAQAGGAQQIAAAGTTVSHMIAGFFIALFALFFFLYDGRAIWTWVVRLFPRQAEPHIASSGEIAWKHLTAFTRATVVVAAADALGIALGALLLGVPFVSGIGLLVFIGAFIPIVGAFVSGLVAVLLALVAKGPLAALLMLGVVILVQQFESHVLQPFLLGRAVRVHPLAVILAIATGVLTAGIVGGLIAVPTIAIANAVVHHLRAQLLNQDQSPASTDSPSPTDSAPAADEAPIPPLGA